MLVESVYVALTIQYLKVAYGVEAAGMGFTMSQAMRRLGLSFLYIILDLRGSTHLLLRSGVWIIVPLMCILILGYSAQPIYEKYAPTLGAV